MRMRPKSARPGAKKPARPAKGGGSKKKMPPELLERFKKKAGKSDGKMKPAVMPKKRGDQKPSLRKPAPKKGGGKMKPAVMPKRQKR